MEVAGGRTGVVACRRFSQGHAIGGSGAPHTLRTGESLCARAFIDKEH